MFDEKSDTAAGALLRTAADVVEGVRNKHHGNKERSFDGIAERWRLYLHQRYGVVLPINGIDVCEMMDDMKKARRLYGERIEDHWLDSAGYIAIAWELEEAARAQAKS